MPAAAALTVPHPIPDPLRILVVQADGVHAEALTRSLEQVQWAYARIDTAALLREALARLKLEKFDLVFADLELPDSGGLATLDAVAQAFDGLIVVLADGPQQRERLVAHGACEVVPRGGPAPQDLDRLLRLASLQAGRPHSLRETEARFRSAFELAGSGIAHLALDGRFLRVNRRLCEILGYEEGELLSRAFRELESPDGSDAGGAERSYRRKDGALVHLEVHSALVRDVAGDPHYEICVIHDITERKRVEARQAAHARYQQAVARFGQTALVLRDASQLVAEALEAASSALGTRAVGYQRSDDDPPPGLSPAARIPVRGDVGVRGVLWADLEPVSPEALAFLGTLASLLGTGLQRIDSEARLSFLARFDPVTGLANRALFTERLMQELVQARCRGTGLAVVSIDLDDFSLVNDTHGHAAGDELLKQAAMRLLAVASGADTVARLSGDQFAVVLAQLGSAEEAAQAAQKILDRLAQPFALSGGETLVTASAGIAMFPADGDAPEALLSAAGAAMYRAKQSGRNSHQFFTSEITLRSRARARLALELRRGLERNEFRLAYQPKIDLRSNRPCGAEALLRWQHPERGLLPPSQFVPVLEETGLILPVGEWVIARACEDIRAWQAAGRRVLPVALNLSARQFRQEHLDRRIRTLVQEARVDPRLIELEITESELMEDPRHAVRVMQSLKESGIRTAIDDFGTGYSSLAYLTRLPLAALKIDRSFVAEALDHAADAAIVRTIIDMAHRLAFTVVAEGVETDAQVVFLRQFGCEQAQGFLFARPMSATEFTALI